jgi:hypothetical protein
MEPILHTFVTVYPDGRSHNNGQLSRQLSLGCRAMFASATGRRVAVRTVAAVMDDQYFVSIRVSE